MHAERCPVCLGKGRVTDYYLKERPCHSCQGKGWIEVRDESPYFREPIHEE